MSPMLLLQVLQRIGHNHITHILFKSCLGSGSARHLALESHFAPTSDSPVI